MDRTVFSESRIPLPYIRQADIEALSDGVQGVATLDRVVLSMGRFAALWSEGDVLESPG